MSEVKENKVNEETRLKIPSLLRLLMTLRILQQRVLKKMQKNL